MGKLFPILAVLILSFALTCSATLYTVGDNSGWDISTDLDTWEKDKTFLVSDVLLFQYSSSHSVSEVTKDNYEGCNMTKVLQTSSNGNTSYTLTNPGDRFFVCGNRLHCLAGMKLHVNVVENQAESPADAPEAAAAGRSLPPASTKSNNLNPSSAVFNTVGLFDVLVLGFFSFSALLFGLV